jgi:hypothetical protein
MMWYFGSSERPKKHRLHILGGGGGVFGYFFLIALPRNIQKRDGKVEGGGNPFFRVDVFD